jgi:DNA-binding NarL/FixJ family response regulator
MRLVIFSRIRLVGETLGKCLSDFPDVEEVVTCASTQRLADDVVRVEPDVVLYFIDSDDTLVKASPIISALSEYPFVGIGISEQADHVIACAEAGMVGYVPRQASLEELHRATGMALKGECSCPPGICSCLLREIGRRRQLGSDLVLNEALTKREREVLSLLGKGQSNKEMARTLRVSVATVKNHLHALYTKLHVGHRTEAVARLRDEPWLAHSA